ncbi:conserved hypothetical protein [Gloeothece citriformis PCC 7424]|uniref:Uncharacterized protein n=1 Tax=Gloeothece citriformis (strain PCC 7424) TaxID=65393 RepID=B7KDF8_GLOC7|nr:hypothetical protein [Gloeothece citriformis]ACK68978.1 conserved hypothetical protein [Gloeothece citriformis PCC 7424]
MPKRSNKSDNEHKQLDIFQDTTPQTESKPQDCWLTVTYQPVSLFSLKRSDATSMAAKSNLVPTPCTIKMALLKILIETEGINHKNNFDSWIENQFKWIRKLTVYIRPPERIVVNRNGYKLRYYDQTADKANKNSPTLPMQDGYVFREWLYLEGNLKICCGETNRLTQLETLFAQINTFGKRGCFFQYLPDQKEYNSNPQFQYDLNEGNNFILQPMDDFGDKATFNRINPFSNESAKLDRDRTIKPGFLPLKLEATSAKYDLYHLSE